MTDLPTSQPMDISKMKMIDTSKIKMINLNHAPDDIFNRIIEGTEFMLKHRADSSTDDSYQKENDPIYIQLQKSKEARTLFITQQISQADNKEENIKSQTSSAADIFLDYMSKTPEEQYFEAFLNDKGLTKEQYEALDPEEKQKIADEIKGKIEERMMSKLSKKEASNV